MATRPVPLLRLLVDHKAGQGSLKTSRLAARSFEEKVVRKIRTNILTNSNIPALVKVVDEQMDGVAGEQRKRLEAIQSELTDIPPQARPSLRSRGDHRTLTSTTSGPTSATTGRGRSQGAVD